MNSHQEINRIDDGLTVVANVDQQVDNDFKLPIELTNATGTYLHQLNEYCLQEIFSSNPLTLLDLCSLAETCKLFKRITQRVFPKEFGIGTYDGCRGECYLLRWKNYWGHYESVPVVERILKNFGSHLSNLTVQWNDKSLANLVEKYCSDVTLKQLEYEYMKSDTGIDPKFKSIFQRLLKLHFWRCDFLNCTTLPDINYDLLVELKINLSSGCFGVLMNTFPKLQQFCFEESEITRDIDENEKGDILCKFISRHNRLRTLHIYLYSDELTRVIGDSCRELVELTLQDVGSHMNPMDFSHLQKLPKLKTLDFHYWDGSKRLDEVLSELKLLETVKITCAEAPVKMFEALSRLHNLREFHLRLDGKLTASLPWKILAQLRKLSLGSREPCGTHLIDAIKQLSNLEQFEVEDWCHMFQLSKHDFSQIVKIVERRLIKLTLKCSLDFVDNHDESKNVRIIKKIY